ncbi:hypothetical protein PanWU01x14_052460 [Parasponia andersonii]|uniref:Uncharacterized protein n=1 Tax=Parasponia andersonii TaxID=3476 RepID=A0A2P5DMC4_PARAD|nr:hypothetical protein PanWU01x14_052460 [Parasponia andersonii]
MASSKDIYQQNAGPWVAKMLYPFPFFISGYETCPTQQTVVLIRIGARAFDIKEVHLATRKPDAKVLPLNTIELQSEWVAQVLFWSDAAAKLRGNDGFY